MLAPPLREEYQRTRHYDLAGRSWIAALRRDPRVWRHGRRAFAVKCEGDRSEGLGLPTTHSFEE
jgi:hypothetical protein